MLKEGEYAGRRCWGRLEDFGRLAKGGEWMHGEAGRGEWKDLGVWRDGLKLVTGIYVHAGTGHIVGVRETSIRVCPSKFPSPFHLHANIKFSFRFIIIFVVVLILFF